MMNKILFIRAFIAGCATIMQIWLTVVVFNNDYQCREEFYQGNNSTENKMQCMATLDNLSPWFCSCRYWATVNDDYWMRLFDEWSTAMASFIFIPLVIIELCRSIPMIYNIFGGDFTVTSFEYCSPFGFLAMILNPISFHVKITKTYGESSIILIDILSIGLIFRYCYVTNQSVTDTPSITVTLISSVLDCLGYLLNLYILNYEYQMKKQRNIQRLLDKNENSEKPRIVIDSNVQKPPPPPYSDQNKTVV